MTELRKTLVLRRIRRSDISGQDLARLLKSLQDVHVVSSTEVMALIEGGAETLDTIAELVRQLGWQAYPLKTVEPPDARPKILRSPSEEKGSDKPKDIDLLLDLFGELLPNSLK